jgi:hypothetical protein
VELPGDAGDQGRLGGLLKLWLVDPRHGAPEIEMRRLLDRLGERFVPLSSLAPGCFRNF